jgi:hypothetical protein
VTPRRLDRVVITAKLRTMRRLLDELEGLGPVDTERFAREFGTQLIVERIVSQVVDLAASVNAHVVAVQTGRHLRTCRAPSQPPPTPG